VPSVDGELHSREKGNVAGTKAIYAFGHPPALAASSQWHPTP